MSKDLFKQAIAEAKSVREAAIANAKEALEETLTPHLKDLLAAKLQEMEDSKVEETIEETVEEVEEQVEETVEEEVKESEEVNEVEAVEEEIAEEEEVEEPAEEEAEDDSEESEDEVEIEDEAEGDEELGDLTVDQFKDLIRDIISQEMGAGEEEVGADLDAGDIEGMGDEPEAIEEPVEDEEEIDLDELLKELESVSEEEVVNEEEVEEEVEEVNEEVVEEEKVEDNKELNEALNTIETLQKELNEVNILNAKLLYVNKIFKANNLTESQKVNIIAAFDKAETVKEVKLVFETVSENVVTSKKENVSESKIKGMASKATGTTAKKPEVINEVSDAVRRMQQLAGIIKN